MQLAFTFHPFGHSPTGSQHGLSSSPGAAVNTLTQVSPQKAAQGTEGHTEPALQLPLGDDSLGPLGQSFMNLAMSHISPSKASMASKSLNDHAYLRLGSGRESTSGVSDSPAAPTTASGQPHSPSPGQPSSSVATPSPQRRNFYPEEASDDEADVISKHSRRASAAGDSGSALPAEFRCQPSSISNVASANDTEDKASYSSQEVYHAYRMRDATGHQTSAYSSAPQHGAYTAHAQSPGQGHGMQPQVPAWRLMGTSPLLEGQQHAQEQQQQQQQQSRNDWQQGYEQQPQIPQWHLLGTSPLHEGQMQHLGQPHPQQVHARQHYQPSQQGYPQQVQGQVSLQQAQPQRAERQHFMAGTALHSGHMSNGSASSTSQSFTCQGRGSAERPLSYASLAVGSWSDGLNQMHSFTKPAASQVHQAVCFCNDAEQVSAAAAYAVHFLYKLHMCLVLYNICSLNKCPHARCQALLPQWAAEQSSYSCISLVDIVTKRAAAMLSFWPQAEVKHMLPVICIIRLKALHVIYM